MSRDRRLGCDSPAWLPVWAAVFALLVATLGSVAGPANAAPAPRTGPSPAAANEQLVFYFGLRRPDQAAQHALLEVSNPRHGRYRSYATGSQVAQRYGAPRSVVVRVARYLRSKSLVGEVDRSRLFMRVRGTASQMQSAFGQPILTETVGGIQLFEPAQSPKLPRRIQRLVPEPVWISQRQVNTESGISAQTQPQPRTPSMPTNQGTIIGCAELKQPGLAPYLMTVPQAAIAYGINRVRPRPRVSRGDAAQRPPIGVLALGEGFSDADLADARTCMGFKGRAQRVETDGLVRLPSGEEGNLDIQMVLQTLAGNRATVPVYEATSTYSSFLGAVAALNSARPPMVLTNSYYACEQHLANSSRRLNDAIYVRLGLVGTGVFAATGDRGSSGCINNATGLGPKFRAVSYSSTSPWVTAVGGTRIVLTKTNRRAAEVTWNDSPWGNEYAGGGGRSVKYQRPAWQPRTTTKSGRRTVPDLSAHASGAPGWPLFGDGVISGTSASTPLVASAVALLNQRLAQLGKKRLGFINPLLYQLPRVAHFDVVSGNTDLWNVGCCRAKRGYDQATGLGSPNFAAWLRATMG